MFRLAAGPRIQDSCFLALPGPALLPEVVDGKATHRPQMKDVRWRQTSIAEAIRPHAMPPFRLYHKSVSRQGCMTL